MVSEARLRARGRAPLSPAPGGLGARPAALGPPMGQTGLNMKGLENSETLLYYCGSGTALPALQRQGTAKRRSRRARG